MVCNTISPTCRAVAEKMGKNPNEVNAMIDVVASLMGVDNYRLLELDDEGILGSIVELAFDTINDESKRLIIRFYEDNDGFLDVDPLDKIVDAMNNVQQFKAECARKKEKYVNDSNKENLTWERINPTDLVDGFFMGQRRVNIIDYLESISKFSDRFVKNGFYKAIIDILKSKRSTPLYLNFCKHTEHNFAAKTTHGEAAGTYSPSTGEIYINLDSSFVRGVNAQGERFDSLIEAIFHEVAHSLTQYALTENEEIMREANSLLLQIKDELAKKGIDTSTVYGLTNVKEMFSEIFSTRFHEVLDKLDLSIEEKKSIWDRIIAFFKRLFSKEPKKVADSLMDYFKSIVNYQFNPDIPFNIFSVDSSKVDVEIRRKPWKSDPTKSNIVANVYLKGQHEKGYFQLVKDKESNYFSVHFKTATGEGEFDTENTQPTTKEERKILFENLEKLIPSGALVSTWGEISPDGIRGLNNVGRGMRKVMSRTVKSKVDGSDVQIPIFVKGGRYLSEVFDEQMTDEELMKMIADKVIKDINSSDSKLVETTNMVNEIRDEIKLLIKYAEDETRKSLLKGLSIINSVKEAKENADFYEKSSSEEEAKEAKEYLLLQASELVKAILNARKFLNENSEELKQLKEEAKQQAELEAARLAAEAERAEALAAKAAETQKKIDEMKAKVSFARFEENRLKADIVLDLKQVPSTDNFNKLCKEVALSMKSAKKKDLESVVIQFNPKFEKILSSGSNIQIKVGNNTLVAVVDNVSKGEGGNLNVTIKSLIYLKYSNYSNMNARKIEMLSEVGVREHKEDTFLNRLKELKLSVGSNSYNNRKKYVVRMLKMFMDSHLEALKNKELKNVNSNNMDDVLKRNEINNYSYIDVFNKLGTSNIFSLFRDTLINEAERRKPTNQAYYEAMMIILEQKNFDTLIRDSISNISEALDVEFSGDIQSTRKKTDDEKNEDSENGEENNVQGLEEVNMDQWTLSPAKQAKHESLTIELRRELSKIQKAVYEWSETAGKMIPVAKKDDIGNIMYLEEGEAFKRLLRKMQGFRNEKELLEKLRLMAKADPTFMALYNKIVPNENGVSKDEKLRAAFYRAMDSQFRNIYATKELATGIHSWQVNRADDATRVMTEALENISNGNMLTTYVYNNAYLYSIYDNNGEVLEKNIDEIRNMLNKAYKNTLLTKDGTELTPYTLIDFFRANNDSAATATRNPNTKMGKLATALLITFNSLGFDISYDGVVQLMIEKPELIYDKTNEYNIMSILTECADPTDSSNEKYLKSPLLSKSALCGNGNIINTAQIREVMRKLASSVNFLADGLVETGMYENKKIVNSITNPSYESKVVANINKQQQRKEGVEINANVEKYDFIGEHYNTSWFRVSEEQRKEDTKREITSMANAIAKACSENGIRNVNSFISKLAANKNSYLYSAVKNYTNAINTFVRDNPEIARTYGIHKVSSTNEVSWLHPWLASWQKNGKFKCTEFELYNTNHAFGLEYDDWSKAAYANEILTQYFKNYWTIENGEKVLNTKAGSHYVGICNPVLSDSPVAEFLKILKFDANYDGLTQESTKEINKLSKLYFGCDYNTAKAEFSKLEINNFLCYYHLSNVAKQEIGRIGLVYQRDINRKKAVDAYVKAVTEQDDGNRFIKSTSYKSFDGWTETIACYDIDRTFKILSVKDKSGNDVELVIPDFSKQGVKSKGGTEFKFLSYLNDEKLGDTGKGIVEYLFDEDGNNVNGFDSIQYEIIKLIEENQYIDFDDMLKDWQKNGLFETGYSFEHGDTRMLHLGENIPVESLENSIGELMSKIELIKKNIKRFNKFNEGKANGFVIEINENNQVEFYKKKDGEYQKISASELDGKSYTDGEKLHKLSFDGYEGFEDFKNDILELEEKQQDIQNYKNNPGGITEKSKALLYEFFNQYSIATALIEELFITDLAYYQNPQDVQKRYKEIYAPSQKLNTNVMFGRKVEKTLYLKDIKLPSSNEMLNGIRAVLERAGFGEESIEDVIGQFKKNNVADAQAYRSPSSYRAMLAMAGELGVAEKIILSRMIGDIDKVQFSEEEKKEAAKLGLSFEKYAYYNSESDNNLTDEEKKLIDEAYERRKKDIEKDIEANRNEIDKVRSLMDEVNSSIKDESKKEKLLEQYSKQIDGLRNEIEAQKSRISKIKEELGKKQANSKFASQIASDSTAVVLMTKKPFTYTQEFVDSGTPYGKIKVGIQHKNSEFLNIWGTEIGRRYAKEIGDPNLDKLIQIYELMEEEGIDVVQFDSAVKVGCSSPIDLKKVPPHVTKEVIRKSISKESIHEISYESYGIQASTPEHLLDVEQLMGSQIRRLILADIEDVAKFSVNGKTLSKKQYFDHYNAVLTENILESFKKLDKIFANPEEVEKLLMQEMSGNDQYTPEMINAARLRTLEDGRKVFDLLSDPIVANKIEALLASIIKKRITKQKIKGGACIQVSCFGCEGLQIVWDKDHTHPIEMQCLMPAYTKDMIKVAMNKDGVVSINKLKEMVKDHLMSQETFDAITTAIGYRVPTEDKYSMARLRIVGFLPPCQGSAIMLPKEITTLSGSDFDVDKMYLMLNEFRTKKVISAKSVDEKLNVINAAIEEKLIDLSKIDGAQEVLDMFDETKTTSYTRRELMKVEIISNKFKEIFVSAIREINNKYFDRDIEADDDNRKSFESRLASMGVKMVDTLEVIKYKEDDNLSYADEAAANTRAARNNRIISLMAAGLESESTARKFLLPGSFDTEKKSARIEELLENSRLSELREAIENIDNNIAENLSYENLYSSLNRLNLDQLTGLTDKLKKRMNPLSPKTQTYFHDQNANGGKLIGVYANHNAGHSMAQYCNLNIEANSTFSLFGEVRSSLHESDHYISKTNAGFLAASVDNVKDTVLSWLNQNLYTADASMLLTRLGYTSNQVCMLMNQPIIKFVVQRFMNGDNKGSKENIFARACKDYFHEDKKTPYEFKKELIDEFDSENSSYTHNEDELAYCINKDNNPSVDMARVEKIQRDTAKIFFKILSVSNELSQFTQDTKSDTQNGAAKASVAENIAKNIKINNKFDENSGKQFRHITFDKILNRTYDYSHVWEKSKEGKYILNEKYYESIRKRIYESEIPFIAAFDECGLNSIERYLRDYMPQYGLGVQKIISDFTGMVEDSLSSDELKDLFEDLNTFWLSKLDAFKDLKLANSADMRNLFAKNFVDYFIKMKNSIKSNSFINALSVKMIDSRNGKTINLDEAEIMKNNGEKKYIIKVLVLPNVGSLSSEIKQRYSAEWESLYYSRFKQERAFALNLLRYSFYRNGLGFSPDSFGHLAPDFRTNLPGYRDHFRNLRNATYEELLPFMDQFVRNHPDSAVIHKFRPNDIVEHLSITEKALGYQGMMSNYKGNVKLKFAPNVIRFNRGNDGEFLESIAKEVKENPDGGKSYKFYKYINVGGSIYKLVQNVTDNGIYSYYVKMSKLGIVSETGNSNFLEYDINTPNLTSAFIANTEEYKKGIEQQVEFNFIREIEFMSKEEGEERKFDGTSENFLSTNNPLSEYIEHFFGRKDKTTISLNSNKLAEDIAYLSGLISSAASEVDGSVCN